MIGTLLNQTVTLEPFASRNEYDEASFGAAVTVKARFQEENKIVKGPQGEDIGTDALVFLPASAAVEYATRVTYSGVKYRVVTISKVFDRGALHHFECRLQRIT